MWEPKSQLNAKALRLFRDGMDDLNDALGLLLRQGSIGQMRTVGRRVSVELRKLLFDNTPLVHRVLHRPRFHPLSDRNTLTGDLYENAFVLRIAPGTPDGPVAGLVATHTWRIAVHPLHGLKFDRVEKKWIFGPLFDVHTQPMALEPWLKQRLFSVDRREYALLDTLKFIANKEAMHVDIDRDVVAIDMERVHFGHTTYPHLVAVMVASYLLERYRASYRNDGEKWDRFLGIENLPVADYEIIGGGEFEGADIDPMGFGGEFHDTGIALPEPDRTWKAVRLKEGATVRA